MELDKLDTRLMDYDTNDIESMEFATVDARPIELDSSDTEPMNQVQKTHCALAFTITPPYRFQKLLCTSEGSRKARTLSRKNRIFRSSRSSKRWRILSGFEDLLESKI